MLRFSWFVLLLLAGISSAQAATYNLKESVPPGCSQSDNGPVTCLNGLNLNWGDIIDANQVLIINVTGNVNLQNAQINIGNPSGVTINATGNITTGYQFRMLGDLNAGGTIQFGGLNQVTGNVNANIITSNDSGNLFTGSLTAGQSLSLGYQNTVTGNVVGGSIITNSQVSIGGTISGTAVSVGSENTIGSSINGTTSVTLLSTGSVINGNVNSSGPITIYSYTTINGTVSGSSVTPPLINGTYEASNITINGNVAAINQFVLPSSSQLTGNVTAGSVQIRASGANITGNVVSGGDVLIESGSGVTGSASSGGTLTMLASNAYITGNATAATEIVIGWAGSIGGTATAPFIQNDSGNDDPVGGGVFCDDSDSIVDQNHVLPCATAPVDPGPNPGGDQCELFNDLADYGVIGDTNFNFGPGSTINGNPILGSEGNSPTPSGQLDFIDLEYPPLDPVVFPALTGTTNITNPSNMLPGQYGTVTVSGNNSLASTAGGTYYIQQLVMDGNNEQLNLAPGDYFFGSITMDNRSYIEINPQGLVRIFVRDGITGQNNIFLNSNGNVNNLIIYLYDNADFTIGNFNQGGGSNQVFNFNGVIYSPYPSVDIEFGNNSNLSGGILSAGSVSIGNGSAIDYSPAVQEQVNQAAGCEPEVAEVNHYRILHPSSVVACYAATVSVRACADASCSNTFDDAVNLNVNASTINSSWQGGDLISGSGSTATLAFSNGTGVSALRNPSGGSATLSISGASPSALNNFQCFDPSGTVESDCSINFPLAGLVIVADDGLGSSPIAPQIAGSATAFTSQLRAVQTNTLTGACEARVSGPQTVQMGVECLNPSNCINGQTYQVNGSAIGLNNQGNDANRQAVSVTFDGNGYASLQQFYTDVGLVRLHASLNLPDAPVTNDPAYNLTGTSLNDFVIRPQGLSVVVIDVPADPINSRYRTAGEAFSGAVFSYNSDGSITPNFGEEQVTAGVAVNVAAMAYPTGANAGANLTYNQGRFNASGFTNTIAEDGGVRSNSWYFYEAGSFQAQARLLNDTYLGIPTIVQSPTTTIGRFSPAAFTVASSSVLDSCTVGDFSYMGEPNLTVYYQLEARNLQGDVTRNYDGSLGYADTAVIAIQAANVSPVNLASDQFDQRLSVASNQTWLAGVLEVEDLGAVFARHANNLADGPFESVRLGIQVDSERDGIDFAGGQPTISTLAGTAVALAGELRLRYGRTVLDDTFGAEGENLPVELRNEYYNGSRFVTNTDDSCFAYTSANLAYLSGTVITSPAGLGGILSQGKLPAIPDTLYWHPPMIAPSVGEFIFTYDTPSWLEYLWADNLMSDPQATGGFGQYRGNDRIIYWLERR